MMDIAFFGVINVLYMELSIQRGLFGVCGLWGPNWPHWLYSTPESTHPPTQSHGTQYCCFIHGTLTVLVLFAESVWTVRTEEGEGTENGESSNDCNNVHHSSPHPRTYIHCWLLTVSLSHISKVSIHPPLLHSNCIKTNYIYTTIYILECAGYSTREFVLFFSIPLFG